MITGAVADVLGFFCFPNLTVNTLVSVMTVFNPKASSCKDWAENRWSSVLNIVLFKVFLAVDTASLAKWLRHPSWKQKVWSLNPACDGIFPGQVIPVTWKLALLWLPCHAPGVYRVSAGTGWPSVSILWLGEVEIFICNFYCSVAARTIVWVDPSLRHTSMLGR